ncbi:MAG: C-type lectin domain-containing protein [Myxococcota bacterium]
MYLLATGLLMVGCYTTLDPTHLGKAQCTLISLDSSQYAICAMPLDYASAAADCKQRGAHLVAMGSASENSAVAAAAFAIVANSNLWLGGTRSDDFVWSWPDGTVFWRGGRDGSAEAGAFVLWQPEEPNNSSSTSTEPEACLALTVENADWNDRSCSLSLPYVCELD